MRSLVAKRSIVIGGHKTSVSLEESFWSALKEISGQRGMTLSEVVREIATNRQQGNLSSAIRLFVLDYFKSRAAGPTGESKQRNGHPPAEAKITLATRSRLPSNWEASYRDCCDLGVTS